MLLFPSIYDLPVFCSRCFCDNTNFFFFFSLIFQLRLGTLRRASAGHTSSTTTTSQIKCPWLTRSWSFTQRICECLELELLWPMYSLKIRHSLDPVRVFCWALLIRSLKSSLNTNYSVHPWTGKVVSDLVHVPLGIFYCTGDTFRKAAIEWMGFFSRERCAVLYRRSVQKNYSFVSCFTASGQTWIWVWLLQQPTKWLIQLLSAVFSRLKTQILVPNTEVCMKWSWLLNMALFTQYFSYYLHLGVYYWRPSRSPPTILPQNVKIISAQVWMQAKAFANPCLTCTLQWAMPEMDTQWAAAATWKELN